MVSEYGLHRLNTLATKYYQYIIDTEVVGNKLYHSFKVSVDIQSKHTRRTAYEYSFEIGLSKETPSRLVFLFSSQFGEVINNPHHSIAEAGWPYFCYFYSRSTLNCSKDHSSIVISERTLNIYIFYPNLHYNIPHPTGFSTHDMIYNLQCCQLLPTPQTFPFATQMETSTLQLFFLEKKMNMVSQKPKW